MLLFTIIYGNKIIKYSFSGIERFRWNLSNTIESIDICPAILSISSSSIAIISENTPSSTITRDSLNFVSDDGEGGGNVSN